MATAAATTRPVVLELGGNDAAILAPDVVGDRALADRLVEAAFVTSGQVCMAIKRLYVHRDRMDETVDALADRLSAEVVGDGLAEDVTMGPVHTAAARDRVEAMVAEAAAAGATVLRPGRIRAEDQGSGGYFVSPALVVAPGADAGIVREEQFAPALPVIPYDDIEQARRRGERHRVRPVRLGVEQRRRAGRRRGGAALGGNRVRQHARHLVHRHVRADGRDGSSRASASSSAPRACRRSPASGSRCCRPGPAEQGAGGMTVAIRGGTVVDGTGAPPVRADVVIEGERVTAVGRDVGPQARRDGDRRRTACSSRPASSTCTPTTTRSSSGTPMPARRRCTA